MRNKRFAGLYRIFADFDLLYTGTNRDLKTEGDIIGISQDYKVVEKWTITAYLQAAVHATFKEVCGVQEQQQEKELSNIQK